MIRQRIFADCRFHIPAEGTEWGCNVSFPQPVSRGLWFVKGRQRIGHISLLNPLAHFFGSVLVNHFNLINGTVIVRHGYLLFALRGVARLVLLETTLWL